MPRTHLQYGRDGLEVELLAVRPVGSAGPGLIRLKARVGLYSQILAIPYLSTR